MRWLPSELAILRTVLYSSLFEYPLTLEELRRTLLESVQSEVDILRTYEGSLPLRRLVEMRDGVFFPRGRRAWVAQRRQRELRSLAFLQRHRPFLWLLCACPFVRLVALSGSIAALNADHRADLDLFVITKGPRAWTITLGGIALARLMGCRRAVCLNFILSDDRLVLEQQDMFAANQIIQLRPLAGADEAYHEFLSANPFVRRFYPNFDPSATQSPVAVQLGPFVRRLKRAAERLLDGPSRLLEAFSRFVYGSHLHRRAATWSSPSQVRLHSSCLKLHTRSHRQGILERFDALCRTMLGNADMDAGLDKGTEVPTPSDKELVFP